MPRISLRELFDDREPPVALRGRVLASLRGRGALRAPSVHRRTASRVGLAAAALLLGYVLGQQRMPADDASPRYLLLLYEDSSFVIDRPMAEIVAEYRGWADSLGRRGRLVAGEKLGEKRADAGVSAIAAGATDGGRHPTGFFIVRAPSLDEAQVIAASSPHVRRGGQISVHAIE